MNFKQRCISSNFVWCWILLVSEMLTVVHGVVVASYGKDFFLPYLVLCNNDAYLHIVPTTPNSINILLTMKLMDDRTIYTNTLNKSEALNVNYSALLDMQGGHYRGWQIFTSQDVSVYLKRSKGDVTILLPNEALGTNYVLPCVAGDTSETFRVIVYAIQNSTTINISGNSFDPDSGGDQASENTTHTLNSYETLVLETNNTTKSTLTANHPVGILLLRWNQRNISAPCEVLDLKTIEAIPPCSSFGKQFYYATFDQQANLTFHVTGAQAVLGELMVKTDQLELEYNVTLNESVTWDFPTAKYVALLSSVPIQVYVTTVVVITETQEYIPCDFFVPPSEQYVRCSLTSSCSELCPLLLNGESGILTSGSSPQQYSFTDANNSTWLNISSQIKDHASNTNDIIQKVWTNFSYVYYVCETETGSVFPAGTRLGKLYDSCVPDIVAGGGDGDGIDNDCDGQIDEESVNSYDDDGDSRVDEDTNIVCIPDVITSTTQLPDVIVKETRRLPRLSDIALDENDSSMPLIAVVLSLSVAIFAVFAVISIFMFLELLSRRKQLRNTKIRPFVS